MQEFFDFIGLFFKSIGVGISLPFQMLSVNVALANIFPSLLGVCIAMVSSIGVVKLILGWI